jgi:hypothetical protein
MFFKANDGKKSSLIVFVKIYYMAKKSRKEKQEWTRDCIITGLKPRKLNTPIKTK